MSRLLFTLPYDASKVRQAIVQAPPGTRVELKAQKRSLDQNNRMWAMLTDVATQREHFGRKYPADTWKLLFLHAWQKETPLIPALDGHGVIPVTRSSDLSRQEMSELIDFIAWWAADNGVTLHEPALTDAA